MTNIPVPDFYSIDGLANELGCDPERILNYGRTGQLRLSILNRGWWLECRNMEEHDGGSHSMVQDVIVAKSRLLKLTIGSVERMVRDGSAEPYFESAEYDYACISSWHHQNEITVSASDIVIDLADVLKFKASVSGTQHHVPVLPLSAKEVSNKKSKPGKSPMKRQKAKQDMLQELAAGKTIAALLAEKQESLAARHNCGRETAKDARLEAIKAYQEKK